MTVSYRKLCNEVFALIFVEDHIFFCCGSDKKVDVDLFVIFICKCDFVVIGDAGISFRLLVFIAFFVVVILVMNRIIE